MVNVSIRVVAVYLKCLRDRLTFLLSDLNPFYKSIFTSSLVAQMSSLCTKDQEVLCLIYTELRGCLNYPRLLYGNTTYILRFKDIDE
jgi:hypothetical protein